MKFLTTWKIHEGKLHDTLALFSKMPEEHEASIMGADVKLVCRWHDLAGGTGAAVFECDNAEQFAAYALHWNRYMDLTVVPVVDDEAAKSLGSELDAGG